jgi:hypothetical protein
MIWFSVLFNFLCILGSSWMAYNIGRMHEYQRMSKGVHKLADMVQRERCNDCNGSSFAMWFVDGRLAMVKSVFDLLLEFPSSLLVGPWSKRARGLE